MMSSNALKIKQYILAPLVVVSLLVLSACGGGSNPAAIKGVNKVRNSPKSMPYPKANPRRSRGVASAGNVVVRKGDTLYNISKRYKVTVRDIIRANRLRSPYTLSLGQRLSLPSPKTHIVKKGETGYSIAQKYSVNLSSMMKINRVRAPFSLSIGRKLKLPGGATMRSTKVAKAPKSKWRPKTAPKKASRYTPKKGGKVARLTPPKKSGQYFAWPVRGQLIQRFGPKQGGVHNDGINILAKKGSTVRASETGIVVYASNALEGYGNLILIKHQGGWMTAYAHTSKMTVTRGQQVKKGQMIGQVGATGGVSKPQLHFEIRRARKALDPLRYLAKG